MNAELPTTHAFPGLVVTAHSTALGNAVVSTVHELPFQWPILAPPAPQISLVDSADMPLKFAPPVVNGLHALPVQRTVCLPGMKSLTQTLLVAIASTDRYVVPAIATNNVWVSDFM